MLDSCPALVAVPPRCASALKIERLSHLHEIVQAGCLPYGAHLVFPDEIPPVARLCSGVCYATFIPPLEMDFRKVGQTCRFADDQQVVAHLSKIHFAERLEQEKRKVRYAKGHFSAA